MRTLSAADVINAPKRSFAAGSAIAQDLSDWLQNGAPDSAAAFLLGEKGDEDRDGSDAQLRDALCTLAGFKREREPILNEDGSQVLSEKRGKPQYRDIPFSTKDRLAAMRVLGVSERELSRDGTKRLVAIVRENAPSENEDENAPNEENED